MRFFFIFLLTLFALIGLALFALSLPSVQRRATREVESWLQEKLGARVEIAMIRVVPPYSVSLEGFLLEDERGDTLARVGNLAVDLDMWKLLDQTIQLRRVTLENASVRLLTRDSIRNYDFILAAFTDPDTMRAEPVDTTASPWQLRLDLATVDLQSVDFSLQDEDAGATTIARIGELSTKIGSADLQNLQFGITEFSLKNALIRLVETRDNPESGAPSPDFAIQLDEAEIENSQLYFSTPERLIDASLGKTALDGLDVGSAGGQTAIALDQARLENSALAYRDPENPSTPGHFNAGDLAIQQLNARLAGFSFRNDTISVQAQALSGVDKSGLQLYDLRGRLLVAPGSITVQEARVRANETLVDGDAVLFMNEAATFDRMQVNLREASGRVGDLLVFLPPQDNPALGKLADFPYTASGRLEGSLQNLQISDLKATAGQGTALDGSGTLRNLDQPDQLGFDLRLTRVQTLRADLVRLMSLGDTPADSALATPLPAWIQTGGVLEGSLAEMRVELSGEAGPLQTGPLTTGPAAMRPRYYTQQIHLRTPEASFPIGGFGSTAQWQTEESNAGKAVFSVAGTLTRANDPEQLGMDLDIRRLEADRGFFSLPSLQNLEMPERTSLNGSLKGNLTDLTIDLKINALRNDQNSHATIAGVLRNLDQADNPGFDLRMDGELTRAEILGYVPDSTVNRVIRLPERVAFSGKAQGSRRAFEGNLGLRLGSAGILMVQGTLRDSTYTAELVGENIQVSRLAAQPSLQAVKTAGLLLNVEGTGFDVWNTARLSATGQFDSLIYDNLILREIVFDADLDGRRFEAGIRSPDARAALNLRAKGDFTGDTPLLETDLTVNCLDLREFGWAYRPTTICLHLTSRSEGLSLDTLLAQIRIENIDFQYDTVHVRPGDLSLDLSLDRRNNRLAITSDWLEGELKGYFSLTDLPRTFNNIAEQYFIVDRSGYVRPLGTDSLSLELNLLRPQLLTTGLVPGLIDLGAFRLSGSLNARTNAFDLTAHLTRLHYLDWELDSLNARAYAGDSAALFYVTVPLVRHEGEFFAKNAGIKGSFLANRANATLTAEDREGRDRFRAGVQAELLPDRGGVVASLEEKLVLDYRNWTVDTRNSISATPDGISVENLAMQGDGGQSVSIAGRTRKTAQGQTGLDFQVDITRLSYDNFAVFLSNTVRDLSGWAEADLSIGGTADAPALRGKLHLHETAFTPAINNVRYSLSETPLEFTGEGLSLDGLRLRDPAGQELKIGGRLNTKDWRNISASLSIDADEFQVLNTTRQQNSVYFGRVFVSVDGRVRGPLTSPQVTASIRTAKKSEFTYIYDADAQAAQHEGIVTFIKPAREYVRPPVYDAPATARGLSLSASIEIDSNLNINTVVNPVTGDAFNGAANGRLQLDLQPNGNMTLSGRVDLVRGVYEYSYQSVVKRSFAVAPGSYILWSGDVGNPELNLIARYEFRASPYPLVVNQLASASPEETSQYRRTQTFFLQSNIGGTPREPNVNFKFIYPSDGDSQGLAGSFGNQDAGLVSSAIGTLNADPNLLSRQVFGVLLLRSFIGESAGPTTSVSGDPLRAGLTSFLTNQVNALAAQYLTFIDVSVETRDAAPDDGSSQSEGTTQYELRLQKSFFDDRLTFKLSGGTSVDASGDASQSGLENASVEYAVTRDGALKITVFSERGFELLNASSLNLRNSGAGVIITKEFKSKRQRRQNQRK